MTRKTELEHVLNEIKGFYSKWLIASGMSEEDFLSFRACNHFRVLLQDRKDGFMVQLSYENECLPIGLPFFIGFENTVSEKEQYFQNTPLILIYLAGRLDKANKERPIHGSYGSDFFKERVRKVCPKILEKGQEMLKTNL